MSEGTFSEVAAHFESCIINTVITLNLLCYLSRPKPLSLSCPRVGLGVKMYINVKFTLITFKFTYKFTFLALLEVITWVTFSKEVDIWYAT